MLGLTPMTLAPRPLILANSMEELTVHIRVRLDDASPMGCARDSSGRERNFSGWIGLLAALDELLTRGGEPDALAAPTDE